MRPLLTSESPRQTAHICQRTHTLRIWKCLMCILHNGEIVQPSRGWSNVILFLWNTNSQHLRLQDGPVLLPHRCSAGRLKRAKCLLLWTNTYILLPLCETAVIWWLISSGLHTRAQMLYFVLKPDCTVAASASTSHGVEVMARSVSSAHVDPAALLSSSCKPA